MKYNIQIFFLFILLTACGQTEKKITQEPNKQNIMNTVETAYKSVKFIEESINYHAKFFVSNCAFELYVNDLPVYKHITGRGMSTSIPINTKILEAGTQSLKIKILPTRPTKDIINEKISSNAVFELTIEAVKYKPNNRVDRLGSAKTWKLSNQSIADNLQKNKENIELAIFEDTFSAKVPYNISGWKNSKNLIKKNKKKLREEVLAFYKSFGSAMVNDKNKLFELVKVKEAEVAQALFFDENESKKQWKAYSESIDNNTFKIEPIENFEMVFYGDGRIVALESKKFTGYVESALKARITEDGKDYIEGFPLLLHIPENSNTLEVIR